MHGASAVNHEWKNATGASKHQDWLSAARLHHNMELGPAQIPLSQAAVGALATVGDP